MQTKMHTKRPFSGFFIYAFAIKTQLLLSRGSATDFLLMGPSASEKIEISGRSVWKAGQNTHNHITQ